LLHQNQFITNFASKCSKYCIKTIDTIACVNIEAKVYYNARYISLILKSNNYAYLRFNYNYYLLRQFSCKFSLKRCNLFLVKQYIEQLVYKLKFSQIWRVYSIILVIQLKSTLLVNSNSYYQLKSNYFNKI